MRHGGSGIPRIIHEFEKRGLQEPEFIDFDGDIRVNLYRKQLGSESIRNTTQDTTQAIRNTTQALQEAENDLTSSLSENDCLIISLMKENPTISISEISRVLDWKVNKTRYYIRKLNSKNFIKRIGTSQKGSWNVNFEDKK